MEITDRDLILELLKKVDKIEKLLDAEEQRRLEKIEFVLNGGFRAI